ncbi:hypothetical protein ACWGLE_22040 [Streptomyces sp. NPDC055897]
MLDPELLERIIARRAELDELEEQLAKQLTAVRAQRDELAVAESVLKRMTGQLAEERPSAAPVPGQVAGRAVMLIPHREPPPKGAVMLRISTQHFLFGGGRFSKYAKAVAPDAEQLVRDKFGQELGLRGVHQVVHPAGVAVEDQVDGRQGAVEWSAAVSEVRHTEGLIVGGEWWRAACAARHCCCWVAGCLVWSGWIFRLVFVMRCWPRRARCVKLCRWRAG